MNETVILVDYENVPKVDLAAIPAGARVPFFFGASQKSVPTDFLKSALKLGDRFMPIDVEGHGKNALDFYIAFYLGEYLAAGQATGQAAHYVILSRDKGFDPLVKHLCKRGFKVQRVSALADAFPPNRTAAPSRVPTPSRAPAPNRMPASPRSSAAPFDSALNWLTDMPKNKRPRKHDKLIAYLGSRFGTKLPASEVQALVARLREEGKISASNSGALSYDF